MSWLSVRNSIKSGSFIKYYVNPKDRLSLQSLAIIKDNYNVISNDFITIIAIKDFFTNEIYNINKEQIIGEMFSKSAFLLKIKYDYI